MSSRTRNLFDPHSKEPYKLSRTRLERLLECPRCFYLDRRLGVDRVSGPAFTLNTATDTLLKKEFDVCRAAGKPHPLMKRYKVNAVPFRHPNIDIWRENFKGVQYLHKPTNLLVTGAVDDIWMNPKKELIVVDYKSTSTTKEIDLNDGTPWKEGYKRQMEIYQWLLRQNGFKVNNTGYFVYVNADTGKDVFDGKLVFDEQLIAYRGDDSWVEQAVIDAHTCLCKKKAPKSSEGCDWCAYRADASKALGA
ncbi:PD-(D/E)XK nuclease family protein [Candidatus Berkelbacteria bacterium]|nr:PD-(D/E)XK nuclease family protein [Candidatus Berkelbacteria bacterium]